MIWLASFPRSGNTFVRNILYEVYGIESSTFHYQTDYPVDKDYDKYEFVKTHELPGMVKPADENIPAVYIIRDGRDTMVSLAYHRKDIIAPGSDFYQNLKEAIIADKGSFFGGWSENVSQWITRADIVFRYEDLLADPIGTVERIRKIYNLPEPQADKLPTFEKLKFGIPKYGAAKDHDVTEKEKLEKSKKFFRRGVRGGWKDDMPDELHDLFWSYHGETMEKLGYTYEGDIVGLHPDLDNELRAKLGNPEPEKPAGKYKVLIESNKIVSPDNDGVKRYQVELLKGFLPIVDNPFSKWEIDLYVHGKIIPLSNFRDEINNDFNKSEDTVAGIKQGASDLNPQTKKGLIERAETILVGLVPGFFVAFLQKYNITVFHKTYEFLKSLLTGSIDLLIRLKNFLILQLQLAMALVNRVTKKIIFDKKLNSYDLIHLPLKHHFIPFQNINTKFISTVHDLTHIYFPEYHTKINISNSENGMKFLLRKKSHIIAVSKSTQNDLLKEFNLPAEKLSMIYEAADKRKFNYKINYNDKSGVRSKYGIDNQSPYIICLSTIEPRKNLDNTIKAFIMLIKEHPDTNLKLVIAGKKGWDTESLQLDEDLAKNRIIFTGFVDDRDISYLYSDALAMCYLSFYEGFGLPPLEAMCCGTPVIFGNDSSLLEVVGEGGIPANPYDVAEIKNKLAEICFDEELRLRKSRAALKQSLKFSWRKTIIETLNAYEKVISDK